MSHGFVLELGFQSRHVSRLAGGGEDAVPEHSLWFDLLALRYGEGNGYMGELVVPEADHHVRPATHSCMNSAMAEEQAKG